MDTSLISPGAIGGEGGNITSSSKGKTGKNTMTEDVEDDVDELPN